MNYLLYRQVPCHACGSRHDLCLVLQEGDQSDIRSFRYECPESRMIAGERLKGHPERQLHLQSHWIECLPIYAGTQAAVAPR